MHRNLKPRPDKIVLLLQSKSPEMQKHVFFHSCVEVATRSEETKVKIPPQIRDHADPEGRREGCRAPGALEESNSRGYEEQRPPPEPSTSPCGREGPRLRGGPIRPAQGSVTRHKTARHEARQERGRKIRKPNGDRGKPMRRSGECLIPSGFERLATDSHRNH